MASPEKARETAKADKDADEREDKKPAASDVQDSEFRESARKHMKRNKKALRELAKW